MHMLLQSSQGSSSLSPQLQMQPICLQDMHMLLQSSQGSSSWGAGSLTNSHHLSVPPQPPPRFSLVGFNNFFAVLRIRDVYPGSEFSIPDPNFFHPGSASKKVF
jgi:hypothetical protein